MRQKRVFIIAGLLLVLTLCTCIGTLAYYTDQKKVENKATFGKVDVETKEKVVTEGKEDVGFTVKNDTGCVDCWVRLFVGIPKASGDNEIIKAIRSEDKNWKEGEDGYWYYLNPVKPGETKYLFKSIKREAKIQEGQQYSNFDIIVYAEAIQKDNTAGTAEAAFKLLKK